MDLFPFEEIRDKQDELKDEIEDTIADGNAVVAHAPTGLGKTAASLTPALEHAVQNDKKVFFVTPRHSQHQIALETVRAINEKHGQDIVSVDLIGKRHLCEAEPSTISGEGPDCPRHNETYEKNMELSDKAKNKIKQLKHENLSAEQVKARCNSVCPYAVSMHMTYDADLIIADYFHIFHPGVREIVMEKADIELKDSIIVVDEAHNLPSRTRSLYSATLSMPNVDRAITECEKFGYYHEEQHLEQLKEVVRSLAVEHFTQGDHDAIIEKKDLKDPIDNFHSYEELIVDLEAAAEEVHEEQEQSYCEQIAEFLESWKGRDEGFVRTIKRNRSASGNRYVQIKYSCLDPQLSTKEPLGEAHASVMMSGTLTPQQMYIDLLGLDEKTTKKLAFESPFPPENKLDLVIPTLTTKYEERDESMIQKYAWYLAKSFEAVPGNCGVFFPSYSMMHKVKDSLAEHTDRHIYIERQSMNKQEKQDVLDDFASRKDMGDSVLLGVAAGSFGEGVDYPGDVMKGVFIVGLPLQRPDLETKGLIEYYDELFGKGWDYGYSYPAMNRAIQAAGRCIRSETDKGVIVYMDKRYEWSNYRKVFPPGTNCQPTRAPWQEIEEFF